ncbi:MAG: ISAs1 family transposase [Alphaproteobacteria bacterium]|nr:ISAs1 family transposase [Alphaproteobacteria bacterium]
MASCEAKRGLLDHFSALEDPRQSWKVVYPLPEIMLAVLCGTMAGAEDFVEIRRWGNMNLDFLRRFLPFARGIPSHDTLNDVVNALDGTLFAACFTAWVDGLREAEPDIVAIDGKTSCRAHARSKGREPLHLVSAWASRQRLVLGQQATDAKSNEITAIPLLLERLELKGALVTIDAMGCQTKIAQAILDREADYLLAVKENWPALHGEIVSFFADDAQALDRYETTDGEHGRIEVRRHAVSHDVGWLATDRRFPGEPRFPGLAAVGMVEAEVERNGKTSRERRYYLCSTRIDARAFARAVRCHWHIENRLHWVLDVVFHDDLCRLRSGFGPQNIATVRHMAMNLIRGAKDKHSLKVRRKSAAWDVNYLESLLRPTA